MPCEEGKREEGNFLWKWFSGHRMKYVIENLLTILAINSSMQRNCRTSGLSASLSCIQRIQQSMIHRKEWHSYTTLKLILTFVFHTRYFSYLFSKSVVFWWQPSKETEPCEGRDVISSYNFGCRGFINKKWNKHFNSFYRYFLKFMQNL